MLGVLVACFAVQTGLVYSDDVDLQLSKQAIEGRRLFHEESCQVCHQLWGQGGFLGPDLTNSASRVDETRLASLLTVGSGQMPALHLEKEQIAAMRAFLEELDRSEIGRGELRLGEPNEGTSPQTAFEAAVVDASSSPGVVAGFEALRSGACSACHFPFQVSIVGAPDLSTVVERLDEAELHEVLTKGRPEKGMPPPVPAFSEARRQQVIEYFRWLNGEREALRSETERRQSRATVDWSRLPWWEYR
ncbi:MAG: c-type cytochrome [Gammaproteobacteria bacterium]|nr:c-type cytochrome [Gammaproteobacteria bacterium]